MSERLRKARRARRASWPLAIAATAYLVLTICNAFAEEPGKDPPAVRPTPEAFFFDDFVAVGFGGEFTHVNTNDGETSPSRADLPLQLQALAWGPFNNLYAGSADNKLYTIDPATGVTTLYRTLTTEVRGMAFRNDVLYVVAFQATAPSGFYLRRVNIVTGVHTNIGLLHGAATAAQGLAFSPGGVLYAVVPFGPNGFSVLTIDLDDAEMHTVSDNTSPALHQSIAFLNPEHSGFAFAMGPGGIQQLVLGNFTPFGPLKALTGDYRGLELAESNYLRSKAKPAWKLFE